MTGAGNGSLRVAESSPEISARSLASTLVPSERKKAHGGTLGVVKQRPSEARVSLKSGEALSLSIAPALDPIEREWQALQERIPVSPYQRFDLVDCWVRHAAAGAGCDVRIGIVRNGAGEAVMILPFGLVRRLGTSVAVYLGGSHFNVNMPLVDPGLRLDAGTLTHLFDAYCRLTGADALYLFNQPVNWRDAAHPFLCMPRHEAPDDVSLIVIKDGDFARHVATELLRKVRSELRRKAARFAQANAHIVRAGTPQDVSRFLDAFIEQKSARLTSQGLDDPFATPGIKAFFRETALRGLRGSGGVEMHALQTARGKLLAVRVGARHQGQYAFMVQSFDTADPLAKYSPSEYLIAEVLAESCRQGFTSFDFGVGANRFKKVWANRVTDLFYVTHAANAKGQLYAGLMQLTGAAARYIKRNPFLFSAVQEARALSVRLRGSVESNSLRGR